MIFGREGRARERAVQLKSADCALSSLSSPLDHVFGLEGRSLWCDVDETLLLIISLEKGGADVHLFSDLFLRDSIFPALHAPRNSSCVDGACVLRTV